MNARSSPVLLAALLAAACNSAEAPKPDALNNAARGNQAASAAPIANEAAQPVRARVDEMEEPAAAPEKADPSLVTRSWFAGRWTDTGDCADAGNFAPNGTYLLADGTRGMWSVQDGKLFLRHAAGPATIRIRKVDETTVEITNPDGSAGRSTRC